MARYYEFSDFDPERFQNMMQELASSILGSGVIAWGQGSDGGRDFSWSGKVSYPSLADMWNGSGIGQVKFKKPPYDPGKDGAWALRQLRADLKKLPKPHPDYYIFCTNVALTAVKDTGSRDRLEAELQKHCFRGFAIWDLNQVRKFLNRNPGTKAIYAKYLQPDTPAASNHPAILIPPATRGLDPYRKIATEIARDSFGFRLADAVQDAGLIVALSAHRFQPELVRLCADAREHGRSVILLDAGDQWPREDREDYELFLAMQQGKSTPQLYNRINANLKKRKKWLDLHPAAHTFNGEEDFRDALKTALKNWLEQHPQSRPKLPPGAGDPSKYLKWLREKNATIDIRGLDVRSGKPYSFPIEDLYIPLKSATGTVPMRTGVKRTRTKATKATAPKALEPRALEAAANRVPLQQALQHSRLVITGVAGSGKSTFLRRIAYELSGAVIASEAQMQLPPCFPILIRIADFEEHISTCSQQQHSRETPLSKKSAEWLVHYLGHQASKWDLTPEFFKDRLNRPDTLLLIDGLDEATNERQRALFARMFEEVHSDYACRIVVTTRPKAYENQSVLHGFTRTEVEDLEPEAVEQFLHHWSVGLHRATPAKADELYAELSGALAARPEIRHMARNPLMLTALAVVQHNDNHLPEQRAELYESIVKWLARQREGVRVDRKPEECLDLFGRLALEMQRHEGGRLVDVGLGQAADWIAPRLKGENPKQQALDILAQEEVHSGIITSTGTRLRYWHLTFQEYLAARAIAGLEDGAQHQLFQESERLYRPEWREVMRLLAGTLMSRQGVEKVEALFRAVLDTADRQPLKRKAECAGLLGSILADLRPTHYVPADGRFEPLLAEVMAIFEPSFVGDVNVKVEAAEAVGRFGDPRLHRDNRVRIPGGTFWIGAQRKWESGPNYDPYAWDQREAPVHRVILKPFRIGTYPVTVAEYAKFLESYPSHQPEDWESQLRNPNRPVVGVNWRDADAWCRWAGGLLPTEAQWEFAARGTKSRRYPWGDDDPTPDHANYEDTGLEIKQPTPVGLFPKGASEHNLMDMAGNVLEWVADWYGPYAEGEQENPTGPKHGSSRVVRGGAYVDAAAYLRSAFRYSVLPEYRYYVIGFRCTWE